MLDILLPGYWDHARKVGYERRWIATILLIQLLAVVFEGIGVGIVLPILQFLNSGGNTAKLAANSRLWGWMLDAATAAGVRLNLLTLLIVAFFAIVLRQIFLYARDIVTSGVQFELQRRVRNLGFDRFIHANLGYNDRVRAGDFVNELTTELALAASSMTSAANLFGYVLLSLAYLSLAAALSWQLTLVAIVVLAGAALLVVRMMGRMRNLGEQVTRANQQMSSFLVERLKSVRLVRLSGVEEAENAMLAARTLDQRNRLLDRRKVLARLSVMIEPIVLAMAFVLLYFSVTVLNLAIERITLFFFILVRLVPIMKEAMVLRQSYLANGASVEVIAERLRSLEDARDPSGGPRSIDRLTSGIEIRDVSFNYMADGATVRTPALDHISLFIAARRTTALVGPSGAGKSTLIDLLPRLREPNSGEILFDDVPQREFNTASLRRAISFAPQIPQMFNVTIAEHIRYGWPEATMKDICIAAGLAQSAEFIEALPEGYNTMLGEGGGHFSGGQRQRIDLARALVRRAPILVLDEPTANLDADAEGKFREALEKVRRETDITIIIIGHRLSTIMSADRIAVLEAGRVTEIGSHAELIATGGWYARAFTRQHGRVMVAAADS
jgi:ATP-binding cassette, subfamily B, bacterial MsbA